MVAQAEAVQQLGIEGVTTIKRWLEATTFLELPWDAYHNKLDCVVQHLAGTKIFDLTGFFLTGRREPVTVECKKYTSAGGQYKEFLRFLATAYSAAIKELESLGEFRKRHYLWVTFHPFNLDNWAHLETFDQMKLALARNEDLLAGRAIDEEIARAVSSRVMVLVFNAKQESLSLTRDELLRIRVVVDRKAETL